MFPLCEKLIGILIFMNVLHEDLFFLSQNQSVKQGEDIPTAVVCSHCKYIVNEHLHCGPAKDS